MHSNQELFDTAVAGIASQGFERSVKAGTVNEDEYPICRYRGAEGRKCAIGWAIPDEKYNMILEGFSASNRQVFVAAGGYEIEFARALQATHDNAESPADMKEALRQFGLAWDLELPEVLKREKEECSTMQQEG